MPDMMHWIKLESSPGVFTNLIKQFGVKGVQVEELWTLDENAFKNLKPVHGIIFLFKHVQDSAVSKPVVTDDRLNDIYFAKQVFTDACASQAIINILLNCNHSDVDIGPELANLKEFTMGFDPQMRGITIGNSEVIRTAHNSMAQFPLCLFDEIQLSTEPEDNYHFVGFVPINGRIYELDGLREGPIDHGDTGEDWLDAIRSVILGRINEYAEGEIHFNLMAVVSDRKLIYERQIDALLEENELLPMESEYLENEIRNLKMLIDFENDKMAIYNEEMVRRRHNYLPFIITLLKILAEEKKLMKVYQKAKERASRKGTKKMKV